MINQNITIVLHRPKDELVNMLHTFTSAVFSQSGYIIHLNYK